MTQGATTARRTPLTGPRSLTFDEVAGRFSQALDKPVTYLPVSDDVKRETLMGYGVPPWIVDLLEAYTRAYAHRWGAALSSTGNP